MTSLFGNKTMVNMDGSSVGHFRYQMPAVLVKHEGSGKMKKSVLTNVKEVCECVGRPTEFLLHYLGQKLNATAKIDKDVCRSYVSGHHDAKLVQEYVLKFISETVMCHACRNPETTCHTEGKNKKKTMFLCCKACGGRSDLDPSDRFVKFMMTQQTNNTASAAFGHAATSGNATCDNLVIGSTSTEKKECPQCSHKTSKPVCSKCGFNLKTSTKSSGYVAEVITSTTETDRKREQKKRECQDCGHRTSKPFCSKCGACISVKENDRSEERKTKAEVDEQLVDTIKDWMAGFEVPGLQVSPNERALESLTSYLKTNGFAEETTWDQLGAMVQAVAENVGKPLLLEEGKIQPAKVARSAQKTMEVWSELIERLCAAAPDHDAVADMVVRKVQMGIASVSAYDTADDKCQSVIVGVLLALREVHGIAAGLYEACQRLDDKSIVMNKFIEFLSQELEDSDSDEGVGEDEVEHA